MSFQPVIVGAGLAGWKFLQSSFQTQRKAFEASASFAREAAYFRGSVGRIVNAAELVEDRRLRSVALGAFGLGQDVDNRYFVRKILESGRDDPDALANKLADDRYKRFAAAFGFADPTGPRTLDPGFPAEILARYGAQAFETAVGEQAPSLRLALNAERMLPELAREGQSETATWFRIMGTPPLRSVFETALGLPKSFGQLDLDRQLATLRDRAEAAFGSSDPTELARPEMLARVIDRFLLRDQMAQLQTAQPAAVALALVQAIPKRSYL